MKKQMSGSLGGFWGRHPETLRAASSGSRRFESGAILYPVCNNAQKGGFTLIELLVVVLIIGILAAVAVPQYEKAVWKSRATALITAVKSVGQAASVYYMANGTYPKTFSELDVDLDLPIKGGTARCGNTLASSSDGIRGNDMYEIMINVSSSFSLISANFKTGKYKCTGFAYVIAKYGDSQPGSVYCWEYGGTEKGIWCEKVMQAKYEGYSDAYRYYRMP